MYKKGEEIKLKLVTGETVTGSIVDVSELSLYTNNNVIRLSSATVNRGETLIDYCSEIEVYVDKVVYRTPELSSTLSNSRKVNQYEIKAGGVCEKIN